ncbi:nicotinate-nucleotide adenylyltransferase [Moritella sp. F3]|uniref:nicotinate-nucleotide adenylyltransferase n=1 Tax=Moritella sp. F3 TaxID=2718882 RepID=UPI0018E1531A|nr:nicotinate-nucleotide adenylyltransferase [Moritella sp. F3]GIC77818.1 putative nicotinate-nucleotide adenylyltransferase [Moritella sp. F1]GIC83041.1 putative nicotinate-nucleotide adenylyltransferase [Moritella sp. F3]
MTDFIPSRAIGILGGTFDPIHNGHLRPCLDLLQQLNLAEVRLMPNHIPPHREAPGSSSAHRLAMAQLAVAQCDELSVDTRELNRTTPSYTIDTLIELAAENPRTPVCFLIGLDSLNSLHTWHRWQELLSYCHLVVSYRPNYKLTLAPEVQRIFEQVQTTNVEDLQQQKQGRILLWPSTQLEISATRIRQLIAQQQNPQYLLPDNVLSYIHKHNLYK